MNWIRNLPIGRKFMLIIMATSAVVLLVASGAFVLSDRLSTQKKLIYLVSSQATLVAANSTAALAFSDIAAAEGALNSLAAQDHIISAVLYTRNGQEFATYNNTGRPDTKRTAPNVTETHFDGNVLQVSEPIVLDNEVIGSIVLFADVNRLYARLGDVTGIVFLVLLGTLMAALLISTRIHRTISDPIKNLADVAQRISSERDYSIRATKFSDDELGGLVDGINEMLNQIQTRDEMLARHAETLENKVEDRTRELNDLTEKLRHRAYHDELTGLANRALFEDRLSHAVDSARRTNVRHAVMFLDLDRFKLINDTLGHEVGDKLLCHVATTIKTCMRKEDTVARMGGDEFTVLLQDIENTEVAGRTARKIIKCVREPVHIDGHLIHISASIGISMYPDDAQETTGLMRCADTAMYLSKEEGRNNYHFFTESMHQVAMKRMRLENELHAAIDNDALTLVYLPKQDLLSHHVRGVEALLRWDHPEFGQLLPQEFLQVAEESGLIYELGNWVLDTALAQLQQWTRTGVNIPRLALNIAGRQLANPEIVGHLKNLLHQYDIAPERIELEFSERALNTESRQALSNLQEFSDLGVKLVIDDFGTDTGSLNQLRKLPIDILKIGKEFIHHISEGDERTAIINAIVLMAHGLGITVVAKGVESRVELDCLIKAGCDEVQGFYLNRPVSADRIPDVLEQSGTT